jgi:hypothetical protein
MDAVPPGITTYAEGISLPSVANDHRTHTTGISIQDNALAAVAARNSGQQSMASCCREQ